jgi:hypothetical protein
MEQRHRTRSVIARLARLVALVLSVAALAVALLAVLYDVGQTYGLGRVLAAVRDRLGADGPIISFILGGLGLILLASGRQDPRSRRAILEVALGILVLLLLLRAVPLSAAAGIGALVLMLLVTLGWAVRHGDSGEGTAQHAEEAPRWP